MGPGIVIPLILLAVGVPLGLVWAKKLKQPPDALDEAVATAPAVRLTSNALSELTSPPWRVIYEIAPTKLGGIEHVLIGPAGIFAVQTSMESLPAADDGVPDPHKVAEAAIVRGALDDALARCALSSDRLLWVHWGSASGVSVAGVPGVIAVDGRSLAVWADSLDGAALSATQVDLAWQTALSSIGRPNPLT